MPIRQVTAAFTTLPWARALLGALALLLAGHITCLADEPVLFDAETGLRIDHYRAPLPAAIEGAKTVDLEDVEKLAAQGAVLIDVHPAKLPLEPLHELWPAAETRAIIPGAVWLPEVGRGRPDPAFLSYFETALVELTRQDRERAIVLFCETDCWMSWNAVHRALRLGYRAVHWFPAGIDAWTKAGRALRSAEPYRLSDQASAPEE
ncbi:rhodanese-like domain-containing protein (plasmid) [Aquamicrobium terrae]